MLTLLDSERRAEGVYAEHEATLERRRDRLWYFIGVHAHVDASQTRIHRGNFLEKMKKYLRSSHSDVILESGIIIKQAGHSCESISQGPSHSSPLLRQWISNKANIHSLRGRAQAMSSRRVTAS